MRRTPNILTKAVLAKIPEMVASGQYTSRQAIADALGCKLSTLSVRCSQNRISLRLANRKREPSYLIRLDQTIVDKLRDHAHKHGMTENVLAQRLIEIIARDNLYDAVLDDKVAA